MFCSFSEQPLILRLYGQGTVIRPRDQRWNDFSSLFPSLAGERQIIILDIASAQTSCGFGVPIYELKEERQTLLEWSEKKGEEGIRNYWGKNNQYSIDGLPTKIFKD